MKSFIVLLSLCTFIFTIAKSQNYFEGTIKYNITYEGRELSAAEKAQMPSEQVVYYKEGQARTDMVTAMGTVITISNSDTKETVLLLDMLGNKMAVKSSKEENEKAISEMTEPEIVSLDETKEIAGYKCKKTEIKSDGNKITAYTTDELNVKDANWQNYKDLTGVMLEYSVNNSQDEDLIMTFSAVEITKSKIKPKIFEVPSDYQMMTQEEFKSMLGGGQ
ncbi:MAG: DUF4412 domain-containing protein [Bacteroidota bacterium]